MAAEDKDIFISGEKMDLSHKDKFVGDLLFNSLRQQEQDKLFQVVVDKNEQMTFGELFQFGARVCQTLLQRGLQKQDIVTLTGPNSNALHGLFVGVIWAGGVPSPVGSDLQQAEIINLLEQLKPKWIFCTAEELEMMLTCVKLTSQDAKVVSYGGPPSPDKDRTRLEDILVDVNLSTFTPQKADSIEDLAIILCSSGTTGFPKCVGLSHTLLLNLHAWDYVDEIDFRKPYLLTSNFAWITGIYFLFASCIYGSFRAVTELNKPSGILKTVQDFKLHGGMIPPFMLKMVMDSPDLRNYDVSSLKEVWTGGSPLEEQTSEKFRKEWPDKKLCECYGLTEAGGIVTKPAEKSSPTSVGRLIFNTDVKIEDPETGRSLGPNETGEICIRSKSLFKTYVGREEEAKKSLKNGWLHTGDVGHYSEDGHLFITSRIKEIIKIEHNQVSPVEIESYIAALPGVVDVGVSGIAEGKNYTGLLAMVVKSENSTITAEHIRRKVAENFHPSKHLTAGVYFVDVLPRSASAKLKRKDLNEMAKTLYNKNKGA